jgi:hypothetical protein
MLREENTPKIFENIVLRKAFGFNRFEVTLYYRKLHNEELHDL